MSDMRALAAGLLPGLPAPHLGLLLGSLSQQLRGGGAAARNVAAGAVQAKGRRAIDAELHVARRRRHADHHAVLHAAVGGHQLEQVGGLGAGRRNLGSGLGHVGWRLLLLLGRPPIRCRKMNRMEEERRINHAQAWSRHRSKVCSSLERQERSRLHS